MAKNQNNEFQSAIQEIKAGQIKPIYFLCGNENYFLDALSNAVCDHILTPDEKEFNFTVLYGKDTNSDEILATAKRYPMMSQWNVVVVKEANAMHANELEKLEDYFLNPVPSTCLCIVLRDKKVDGRKAWVRSLKKNKYYLESGKLYDNQVPAWLDSQIKAHGLQASSQVVALLADNIGADLSKLESAVKKLKTACTDGVISSKIVEEQIGINREFNVFELINALSYRQKKKAFQILEYLANNENTQPKVMVLGQLYGFFNKIMIYHYAQDKSQGNIASLLKINPFFVKDYQAAARNFSAGKVFKITNTLRKYDMKSKGKDAGNMDSSSFYKELGFMIFNL